MRTLHKFLSRLQTLVIHCLYSVGKVVGRRGATVGSDALFARATVSRYWSGGPRNPRAARATTSLSTQRLAPRGAFTFADVSQPPGEHAACIQVLRLHSNCLKIVYPSLMRQQLCRAKLGTKVHFLLNDTRTAA